MYWSPAMFYRSSALALRAKEHGILPVSKQRKSLSLELA